MGKAMIVLNKEVPVLITKVFFMAKIVEPLLSIFEKYSTLIKLPSCEVKILNKRTIKGSTQMASKRKIEEPRISW